VATRIQVRRGTTAQWTTSNTTLDVGEFGFDTTLSKLKIGDGSTAWASLAFMPTEASLSSSLGDYVPTSELGAANGVAELNGSLNVLTSTGIVFEGSTADAYETTLSVTDPTADRTITLPNSSGTVVVADGSGNVTITGNLTVSGTTTTIDSSTINVVNSFVFEGATADAYETTLTITDPTADRTITLPDVTGTVITNGNFPALTWGQVKNGGAL
jgi:hypothetical protein